MKREAFEHTKMKRLCRRLDIPLWQGVGLLETLWNLTGKQAPRGDIGRLSDEDIAIGIDYRENETVLIEALVNSGWLDRHPDYRLLVHDWPEHADDGIHMKLSRGRLFFAIGSAPKTCRLPKYERVEADTFYQSVRTEPESVRTEVDSVYTPCADPRPAPPRPAFRTNTAAAVEVPRKTSPPPNGQNGNTHNREALEREVHLHEFARNALVTYPGAGRLFGSPDDVVIGKCLQLSRGHPGHSEEQALAAALKCMAAAKKAPGSSWMWFPTVMKQYLEVS